MSDPELRKIDHEESGEGFVRERIVNKPSRKKVIRKLALTCVCGILFGVLAGISLAAVFPAASEWFAPEETQAPISIPKDETPGGTESEESPTEEQTTAPVESTEPSTEETESTEESSEASGMSDEELIARMEKLLGEALNHWSEDPAVMKRMYGALAMLGRNYNTALVTIVMKDMETDWFENQVETSGECVGVIWNEGQDGSLYILSGGVIPETDVQIQVRFHDGSKRDAQLCAADRQTGLMMLKIAAEQVDEALKLAIRTLPLGNSYMVTKGQPVLVIGGLVGDVGVVIPAVVTYTEGIVIIPDGMYRKIYLDCSSMEGTNGFVVSLEGDILGIITPETSGSVTSMIGISDLKGVLELLANGQRIPYLGIVGQTVTADIQEKYGLPSGIYINEVIVDSPAYEAGIKAGDVLVSINSEKISSIRGMRGVIENLLLENAVTVIVQRSGNGEYQALEFKVTPGVR